MTKQKMRPVHPGEILREEFLMPLGMTPNALSMELRVHSTRINDLVREHRGISADMALRLARFFNTTPRFWLNLQTSFDLKRTEMAEGDKIEHEIHPMIAA